MKKCLLKWNAFLLAIIIALTMLPIDAVSVFAAAKPAMSVASKTVIGENQEFKLSIKNLTKSNVKSSSWYSTNKKVVTVSDGYVTSAGKGTAYIKCKITYKNGTVIIPSCKVTVKIPATAIEITNAQDDISNNSRQVIAVGDTYDFNSKLTPANADNYITYTISNTDYATVDKKGIVMGKKPGFVTLTAKANLTKPADYKNLLDKVLVLKDSINLEIVSKTVKVTSVELTDTTTLTVTFDEAIDEKTLLNDNKQLLNNITITTKSDSNGVIASALGTLTGSLSSDGKTFIIKTTGYFNGLYGIKFSGNIQTTDSEPLMEYYKTLSLYDTEAPEYKNYTIDDTGLIASINFSEAMNYTGLKIEDVEQASGSSTAKASTITRLSQKSNYKASDDGKSLTIDLSLMSSVDQDKRFKIVFSGLKDRAGNYPDNDRITAYLATDTTAKPQAKLVSLVRTDTNTLTATFTRAIETPGKVLLSNGEVINGTVDEDNTKQVTYTLDSDSAKLTGKQEVNIGYWDSYNVKTSDDSADDYKEVKVNFTIVTTVPELSDYELFVETDDGESIYSLILTFDKEVTLLDDDGTFIARLVTDDGDVYNDYIIGYTADADDTIVTVVLDSDDLDQAGTYTITIPEEFVEDDYGNTNLEETVKIDNTEGSSTALPKPKAIVQSDDDASIIYVTFANQLDEDTAEDVGNYDIEDADIKSAELIDNSSGGATVELTLEEGCITKTSKYSVTISGITGYHSTYTEMEEYEALVTLHENTGPEIEDYDYTYPDTITITFDETLAGTASFQVLQDGVDLVEYSKISGKKVIITLEDKPTMDEEVEIVPTSYNHITDKYGNEAEIDSESLVPTH
ncbi:MAG: Ig-like domain-containing protein [Anaerocolumna sp.]